MQRQSSRIEVDREAQAQELVAAICGHIQYEDPKACRALFDLLTVALDLVTSRNIPDLDNLLWYAQREAFTYTSDFDAAVKAATSGHVVVEDRSPDDHEDGQSN